MLGHLRTDKYLNGIREGSRASRPGSLSRDQLNEDRLAKVKGLAAAEEKIRKPVKRAAS